MSECDVFYYFAPIWVRSIAISLSACLFFSDKDHTSRFHQIFLYMLSVTTVRSSSDISAIRYVFAVLWMTPSMFYMMERMGQNQRRRDISSRSPGGGTGKKVSATAYR